MTFAKSKTGASFGESLCGAYGTAYLLKLSIMLGIFAVLSVYSMFSPKIIDLQQRLYRPVQKTQCIIYDRPPRTGSTTISQTLGKCIASKGYDVARLVSGMRSSLVPSMVSSESDRMAIARNHMAMREKDVELLRANCGRMFYITSAAPMKKRLYSILKYVLLSGNSNRTITRDMVEFAKKQEERSRQRELYLEAYPHVTDVHTPRDVIPEKIVPDYVIRKGSLNEDLTAVLKALKCDNLIETSNVHKATTEESEALDAINVYAGDTVYKWLIELSKDNESGLRKARTF